MKCVMCLEEKAPSREHIFPAAIGGRIIFYRVCKECNSWLGGNVDDLLTEHFLIQVARIQHDLRGSRGSLPRPVKQGHLPTGEPIDILYGEDGRLSGFSIPLGRARRANTITFTADQCDQERLRTIVNNVRQQYDQTELTQEEFEEVITLTQTAPTVLVKLDLDITAYQRAILKIAYELACRWLGDAYLEDETAQAIRLAVMDKTSASWLGSHQVNGHIDFYGAMKTPLDMWDEEQDAHVALLARNKNLVVCSVRIFKIFQGQIIMSNNATSYPRFEAMVAINPIADDVRESTLIAETRHFQVRSEDEALSDEA